MRGEVEWRNGGELGKKRKNRGVDGEIYSTREGQEKIKAKTRWTTGRKDKAERVRVKGCTEHVRMKV